MELMPGFKQTEVGVIPEDWEVYELSELITAGPKNGYSGRCNTDERGTPTLLLSSTSSGQLVLNKETIKFLEERLRPGSEIFLLNGDVLVQRANTSELVGTTAIFNGPSEVFAYPDLMMRLRFRETETAHWFWRYANSRQGKRYFSSVASGSTGSMPKISSSMLRQMLVPLPPLNERRAIIETLNDIDRFAASLKQILTKKHDIKQATMQELLTGKRRLPGFEGEWEVKRLGSEIRDLQAGVSVTSTTDNDQTNTDHYVLKTSAVVQGRFIPSEKKEINPGEVKRAKTSIRKGDLIISRMNTPALVGECGYSDSDHPNLYLPDRLWRAAYRDPSAISSHWLSYALSMQQNRIRIKELATGTSGSMKNISKRELLNLEIKWPSLEEQTAIAEILSEMDADIDAIGEHLLKAQGIKQGMMQQLLTGKIRLI